MHLEKDLKSVRVLRDACAETRRDDVSGPDSQAVRVLGVARLRRCSSRSTSRSAPARCTRRRFSACSGRRTGTSPTCSRRAVRPTAGSARTRTGSFKHHQFQVILKPAPDEVQQLYLESLEACGINPRQHDIRFEEDNWESPTLGAWGIGWQVMFDGMEISQFTYFQQAGGIELSPISAELTYGLERIAMALQRVDSMFDLEWARRREVRRGAAARGDRAVEVRLRPGRPAAGRSSARSTATCSSEYYAVRPRRC